MTTPNTSSSQPSMQGGNLPSKIVSSSTPNAGISSSAPSSTVSSITVTNPPKSASAVATPLISAASQASPNSEASIYRNTIIQDNIRKIETVNNDPTKSYKL